VGSALRGYGRFSTQAQFSQIAIGETKRELVEQLPLRIGRPDRPQDTAEKLGNVQAERDWSEKSSGSPQMRAGQQQRDW